jgi:HEAT repeats
MGPVQHRKSSAVSLLGKVLVLLLLGVVGTATAQDEGVLLRLLQTGKDFRVRAQAAFALGRKVDESYAPSLERALGDKHPVVRAAAASALGRIGAPRSLTPLRAATKDRESTVVEQAQAAIAAIEREHPTRAAKGPAQAPAAPEALKVIERARYAIVVGKMSNESDFPSAELARVLGTTLQRELSTLRTVAVLTEQDTALIEAAAQRNVPVLRIDGNVRQVQRELVEEQVSVHCEISLLVMDQRDRNLRTVLKGGATGIEPSMGALPVIEKRLARKAVEGAVHSALRNASSAIENAAARSGVARGDTATAALRAR